MELDLDGVQKKLCAQECGYEAYLCAQECGYEESLMHILDLKINL